MKIIKNILDEKSGISCMRLMSLLSLSIAGVISFIEVYRDCTLQDSMGTIGIFVGAAFGGKVWQKYAEVSGSKSDEPKQ